MHTRLNFNKTLNTNPAISEAGGTMDSKAGSVLVAPLSPLSELRVLCGKEEVQL